MTDNDAGHPKSVAKETASLLDELLKAPQEPAPEGTTAVQIRAFLTLAIAKHREGQLAEAEQMYRQVLRWQPDNPDAYHLLGLLAGQLSRFDDALALFEHAIALNPAVPEYHANLGNALKMTSRLEEAEGAFVSAISLRPDYPEALMNLATVRRSRGDLEDAERLLRRSLQLRPNWADAQINLANVALAQRRFEEATTLFSSALQAEPGYVHVYESFARAASRAGRLDEAAAAFRRLLSFDPENVVSRHLLAACISDPHCERAPVAYVRKLFDHYAPHFDESLARLQYRAPQLIVERLTKSVAPTGNFEVLDAGCGTGLCGPLLKPFAARLVGVDLSPCMLAEAAKRELYDELVEAELGAYMAAHPSSFSIIVCCDTLVYLGQLEDTIATAATALTPGGLLLFTLEHLAADSDDRCYRLAPTGRFSHSAAYVRRTLANAGLVDVITDPIIARLECGEPVHGLLVIARSSPRKTTTKGCEQGKRFGKNQSGGGRPCPA